MEKRLVPVAEKSLGDYKYYYIIAGFLSLIYGIAAFIWAVKKQEMRYYTGAFTIFFIPIAICTFCFVICAIEYMFLVKMRKYLYKYGVSIEGTVKKVKESPSLGLPSRTRYYLVVTYEYRGKKRKWRSPLYKEPLEVYFNIGGPCRLHVKNRLVCLDEE